MSYLHCTSESLMSFKINKMKNIRNTNKMLTLYICSFTLNIVENHILLDPQKTLQHKNILNKEANFKSLNIPYIQFLFGSNRDHCLGEIESFIIKTEVENIFQ